MSDVPEQPSPDVPPPPPIPPPTGDSWIVMDIIERSDRVDTERRTEE